MVVELPFLLKYDNGVVFYLLYLIYSILLVSVKVDAHGDILFPSSYY